MASARARLHASLTRLSHLPAWSSSLTRPYAIIQAGCMSAWLFPMRFTCDLTFFWLMRFWRLAICISNSNVWIRCGRSAAQASRSFLFLTIWNRLNVFVIDAFVWIRGGWLTQAARLRLWNVTAEVSIMR